MKGLKMNRKTLKALKGSMNKWAEIRTGSGVEKGTDNCSLCKLFHTDHTEVPRYLCCRGCPVFEKSGMRFCNNTPFVSYSKHATIINKAQDWSVAKTPQAKGAATRMFKYLAALMPVVKRKPVKKK